MDEEANESEISDISIENRYLESNNVNTPIYIQSDHINNYSLENPTHHDHLMLLAAAAAVSSSPSDDSCKSNAASDPFVGSVESQHFSIHDPPLIRLSPTSPNNLFRQSLADDFSELTSSVHTATFNPNSVDWLGQELYVKTDNATAADLTRNNFKRRQSLADNDLVTTNHMYHRNSIRNPVDNNNATSTTTTTTTITPNNTNIQHHNNSHRFSRDTTNQHDLKRKRNRDVRHNNHNATVNESRINNSSEIDVNNIRFHDRLRANEEANNTNQHCNNFPQSQNRRFVKKSRRNNSVAAFNSTAYSDDHSTTTTIITPTNTDATATTTTTTNTSNNNNNDNSSTLINSPNCHLNKQYNTTGNNQQQTTHLSSTNSPLLSDSNVRVETIELDSDSDEEQHSVITRNTTQTTSSQAASLTNRNHQHMSSLIRNLLPRLRSPNAQTNHHSTSSYLQSFPSQSQSAAYVSSRLQYQQQMLHNNHHNYCRNLPRSHYLTRPINTTSSRPNTTTNEGITSSAFQPYYYHYPLPNYPPYPAHNYPTTTFDNTNIHNSLRQRLSASHRYNSLGRLNSSISNYQSTNSILHPPYISSEQSSLERDTGSSLNSFLRAFGLEEVRQRQFIDSNSDYESSTNSLDLRDLTPILRVPTGERSHLLSVGSMESVIQLALHLETSWRGISSEELDRLPTHQYKSSQNLIKKSMKVNNGTTNEIIENAVGTDSEQDKVPNQDRCMVCLEEFGDNDQLRSLSCRHQYHVNCVDKWLKINRTCPMCRADAIMGPSRYP